LDLLLFVPHQSQNRKQYFVKTLNDYLLKEELLAFAGFFNLGLEELNDSLEPIQGIQLGIARCLLVGQLQKSFHHFRYNIFS
jgi:hypothetical protein